MACDKCNKYDMACDKSNKCNHWILEMNITCGKTGMEENINNGGFNENGDILALYPTLAMINGGFIHGDGLYGPGCVITICNMLLQT